MSIVGGDIIAWSGYSFKIAETAAADYPAVGDVEQGVAFDSGNLVGTFVVPAETNVALGIEYGENGEFTGQLVVPGLYAESSGSFVKAVKYFIAAMNISAVLSRFDFDEDTEGPAIFSLYKPPEANAPYIVLAQGDPVRHGTRGSRGFDIPISIELHGDIDGRMSVYRNLAMSIWSGLDRGALSVSGWQITGMYCSPPVDGEDSDGFPMFSLNLIIKAYEV